jgi:dienelactone hydrolase
MKTVASHTAFLHLLIWFVLFALPSLAPAAPPADTVLMGGGYPVAVVKIPVDDPKTKYVAGALFEPEGAGPFPAVVMLNGCSGVGPDAETVRRLNTVYLAKGIATLVVDSFTPRGVAEACSDPNDRKNLDAVDYRIKDTLAASEWLSRRPEIDPSKIFLQGYSQGAMAAIALMDPQKTASPPAMIKGVVAFYPYCYADSKFSVPTLILVGAADDWTPAKLCEGIADKTNLEVVVYPEALHAFAMPGLDLMYLGHHVAYQEAAATDAQRRAFEMIQRLAR